MPAYTGTSAANTLDGTTGADTLTGLAGNDSYLVNHLGDVVVEASGGGIDTIRTTVRDALGTFSLESLPYVENLTWLGAAAIILKGNGAANVLRADATRSTADTLYGGAGHDSLHGYGGNDSLIGGSGNDWIDGGTGADQMIGGTGDDRYVVDSSLDRAYEYLGGGFDIVLSSVAKDLRVAWAAQIEGLTYTGTTAATLTGNALGNRIVSNAAGNDTLWGGAGNDTLDGGAGSDTLRGGLGNDLMFVATTGDAVVENAGEGNDTIVGIAKDLTIAAYATSVENLFHTGATGAVLKGNALANLVSGAGGNDTITGGDGNDTLLGGAGSDSLAGGNGDDMFYGGANPDYFWVVDRKLRPDTVADTLAGGAGNDRYLIDSLLDTVVETSSGGTQDVVISAIDNSLARYANVEALVLQRGSTAWYGQGSDRSDILVGNALDNYLVGGAGNDTLSGVANDANLGTPQSDVLDGGAGNDVLLAFDFGIGYTQTREFSLFGGSGDDLYVIGTRFGSVGGFDSAGTDTALFLASGSAAQLEGVENILLWGFDAATDSSARGAIQAVFGAANFGAAYLGSYGPAYNATGNDLDNLIVGNGLANLLAGGAGDDAIAGGLGHDTLEGGDGTDTLAGGLGNDWYYLDSGDTAIELANQGYDVLASATLATNAEFADYDHMEGWQYLGSADVDLHRGTTNTSQDYLGGGSGGDLLRGYGGNDTLDGGAGDDTLAGGTDQDALDGGDGSDQLAGQAGDDTLAGGDGDDTLDGGDNWDRLGGGAGVDSLIGGAGRDTLDGSAGDDELFGGANDDTLIGGAGSDLLHGGGSDAEGRTASHGDHLWGGAQYGSLDREADFFVFDTVSADNAINETFTGSGVWEWTGGATIGDFEPGLDLIAIAAGLVGNGDAVIDFYTETTAPGETFAAGVELVFVRADVAEAFAFSDTAFFDDIDAASVAAVLGDADVPIALNDTRLLVFDDGTHSAVFLFQSNDGNAAVTIDELYLLAVVTASSELLASDFALF
jgi:Ca2+-binding RTX toxin-like protein